MGRLADLAGMKFKGGITVTDEGGLTVTYLDESTAERATAGCALEYRRGAFFSRKAQAASEEGSKKKK